MSRVIGIGYLGVIFFSNWISLFYANVPDMRLISAISLKDEFGFCAAV